jgi:hypothetical protein
MKRAPVFLLLAFAASSCAKSAPIEAERPPTAPVDPPPRLRSKEPVEVFRLGIREKDPTPEDINRLQYSECEPGQTRSCGFSLPSPRTDPNGRGIPIMMECRRLPSGAYAFDRAACATPIVVSFDDAPVRFTRAPAAFAVGPFARTEWVSAATPWLALDRDGSGCVEDQRELFGADEAATNGFEKLARLDANHDGRIDAADAAFADLALWYDRDEDKRCAAAEMVSLAGAGVEAIDLAFTTAPRSLAGSHEGERAAVVLRGGKKARAIDVYLAPLEEP